MVDQEGMRYSGWFWHQCFDVLLVLGHCWLGTPGPFMLLNLTEQRITDACVWQSTSLLSNYH